MWRMQLQPAESGVSKFVQGERAARLVDAPSVRITPQIEHLVRRALRDYPSRSAGTSTFLR